jgi:hypothetical protein
MCTQWYTTQPGKEQSRAGHVTQVVECLLSKFQALISNASKKIRKKRISYEYKQPHARFSQYKAVQLDMVVHACNSSCSEGRGGRIIVRGHVGKSMKPCLKNKIKS